MRELIKEFREWQQAWDAYQQQVLKNPQYFKEIQHQPPSVDKFIEELEKKYTVKKK